MVVIARTIARKIKVTPKCVGLSENLQLTTDLNFSNKFDLCYYGQVNLLLLKSSASSKWQVNTFWGNIYFAGDGTFPKCAD